MAVRQAGLRRALGACARTLSTGLAVVGGRAAWEACPADSAPSTSYATQVVRNWHEGKRHQGNLSAAAAAQEPRQVQYKIEVVTGDVRGAGCPSPAIVTLYGSGDHAGAPARPPL